MNIILHRAIAAIFAVPAVSFGATVVLNGGTINQCTMRKSVTLPNGDIRIDCAEAPQTGAFVVNPPCLVDNKTIAGKPVIRVSCDVEEDIRRFTLFVGNADGSLRAYQQSRLGRPDGIYSLTDAATQGGYYTYFGIWEGEGTSARRLIEPISLPINSTATGCFLRPHLNRHPDFSQFAANLVAVTAECPPTGASRIAALEVKQVGASTADKITPIQFEGTAGSATAASFLLDKLPRGSYEVKLLDGTGQAVSIAYPITVEPFDYNNVLNGPGGLATLFGSAGNSCFFQDNQLQSGDRAAFLCGTAPTPAPTAAPTPAPTATPAPSQCQISPINTSVLAGASTTFSAICSPQLVNGTVVTWRLTNASGTEVNNSNSATSYQTPTTLTAGTYTLRYNFGSAQASPATLTVSGSPTAPSPSPTTAPPTGGTGPTSCGLAIQDLFGQINISLVSCTPSNPSARTYSFLNLASNTQFATADTGPSVNSAVTKPLPGQYRITAIATPGFTTGSISCDFTIASDSQRTMTPGTGCTIPTPGPTSAPTPPPPTPTLSPTPSCTLFVPATSQAGVTKFSATCVATAVAPINPRWEITSTVTATNTQTVAAPAVSPYIITLPATVVDGTYTVKFLADNASSAIGTQAITVAPTPAPPPAGQCSGIADSSEQQYFNEGVSSVLNPYLNANGFKAYEFVITPIAKPFTQLSISMAAPDNNAAPDLDIWVTSCPQEGGPSGTYAPECRKTSNSGLGLAYDRFCKVSNGDKVVVNFKASNKVLPNTQIKIKFDYQ